MEVIYKILIFSFCTLFIKSARLKINRLHSCLQQSNKGVEIFMITSDYGDICKKKINATLSDKPIIIRGNCYTDTILWKRFYLIEPNSLPDNLTCKLIQGSSKRIIWFIDEGKNQFKFKGIGSKLKLSPNYGPKFFYFYICLELEKNETIHSATERVNQIGKYQSEIVVCNNKLENYYSLDYQKTFVYFTKGH